MYKRLTVKDTQIIAVPKIIDSGSHRPTSTGQLHNTAMVVPNSGRETSPSSIEDFGTNINVSGENNNERLRKRITVPAKRSDVA